MGGHDWQRIEETFGAAAELPPTKRAPFLDAVCGGDEELRREIEELLAAEAAAGDFLVAAFVAVPRIDRIGPYRLLGELGRGGMGIVHRARRDDGMFQREVAIKVLHNVSNPEAARRLEIERHVLSRLDHPSIARLYDGGTTVDGSPYVVMEWIDGTPIDEWCHARRLDADGRVDLVLQVLEAVAEAHRHLVVHRDLKPSNILVTAHGVPKLLDFGIAKPLAPDSVGLEESVATASWQRLLTPSYASPEQIRGDLVTTASDVYQLGIVLYRLLTGQPPHDLEGLSLSEIERLLSGAAPRAPSRVLREIRKVAVNEADSPEARAQGVRTIARDLDAVLKKALRGDPAERYTTVEQFAADLRCYRGGFPVEAREGRLRERALKFGRRHWRLLATAAAVLFLVVGFAVDRGLRTLALDHAERESARAEIVQGFVLDLLSTADPRTSQGETLTVVEALERSDAVLVRRFGERSDLEALLRVTLGRIYTHLDLLERAEKELRRALQLRRERFGPRSPEVASTLGDLARALVPVDADAAKELAREAVAIGREVLPEDSLELFELLNQQTYVLCWRREYAEAAPAVRESLKIAQKVGAPRSTALAAAWASHGLVLKRVDKDFEGARRSYRKALALFREIEGEIHPEVANVQHQVALLTRRLEGFTAAIDLHLEVLEMRRRLYPDGHWEIVLSLSELAALHRDLGDFATAEEMLREAVETYENDPDRGPLHGRTIDLTLHLAEVLLESARPSPAGALARVQLARLAENPNVRPRQTRWAESLLGGALAAEGRHGEARTLLQGSLCDLEQGYGAESRRVHANHFWQAVVNAGLQ